MYATAADDELPFQEFLSGNCFGDYLTRTGISVPGRELLTFALLAALGGRDVQVKSHAAANLNVGNIRRTLLGVLAVLVPLIGYPRTLNALAAFNEADSVRVIHRALDAGINFVDTLNTLTDLVRSGKVRYIGSSSYAASQIVEAQWTARDRHLQRFVTEQPPYSILVRGIETDVLPTARRHGMGILSYSPLSGGWLSGRWTKESTPASAARPGARFDMTSPANQRKLEVVDQLSKLAGGAGLTLIELAIAFVINHPAVTAAIIGPRTMEQLESQLTAADITLTTDILDAIDKLVAPGVTINPDDNSYGAAELTPAALRRSSAR